ncbi:MAG: TetR/AcrR family transcriptional regulator [Planctomycetota bacterium]|nr:TetR/AcrR family transcriptional regulator [Planctomycetota bacterium]
MTGSSHRKPGRPANEAVRHQREEEILDAATRLFAEHGFSNANTQVLADMLGVGKGTIYRYFPSKQELFLAAVDRAMRQATDTIDRALGDMDEPLVRMLRAMTVYLAFFAQHPEYVELIIQERAQFKDRKKPTYFVHRDANVVRWQAAFRALTAAGRVRGVPAERITDVLSDMLYGRMFTNYFVGSTRPPEEQASEIFDIAFYGILSDSERTRAPQHI